jgi:hypothetical protein
MSRFAIRLLTLAVYTTALAMVPMVTPAKAATNTSKEIKKKKKITYRSHGIRIPGIANARSPSANPFSSNMYDDFDRKNAGGGGGY